MFGYHINEILNTNLSNLQSIKYAIEGLGYNVENVDNIIWLNNTTPIAKADILIVATGAQNPTIDKELILQQKELLILDLSIPKNVNVNVKSLSNVKTKKNNSKKIIEFENVKIDLSKQIIFHGNSEFKINNTKGNIISPGFKKIVPEFGIIRNEHRGNLIIEFIVKFPNKLTEKQITTIENIF